RRGRSAGRRHHHRRLQPQDRPHRAPAPQPGRHGGQLRRGRHALGLVAELRRDRRRDQGRPAPGSRLGVRGAVARHRPGRSDADPRHGPFQARGRLHRSAHRRRLHDRGHGREPLLPLPADRPAPSASGRPPSGPGPSRSGARRHPQLERCLVASGPAPGRALGRSGSRRKPRRRPVPARPRLGRGPVRARRRRPLGGRPPLLHLHLGRRRPSRPDHA
ncbi:hypothetical protein LTR94_030582, partial [Friedmanniomyces endolithicus]